MVARGMPAASRRRYDRLIALRGDPARAAAFAAEVVRDDRNPEVLRAAVAALVAHPIPETHDALRERYSAIDSQRGDAGGFTRAAIIKALRTIAQPDDAACFERAATTFEPSPNDGMAPAMLRAAGVIALNDLDDRRAGLIAVQLLADRKHTSPNGEPAVSAAAVLAANGQTLPLYLLAIEADGLPGEVLAACFRGLATMPGDLLASLVDCLGGIRDELVRVAMCDALIACDGGTAVEAELAAMLERSRSIDLYRYVAAALAASREERLVRLLLTSAERETNDGRLRALAEVLPLVHAFAGADDVARVVGQRLSARAHPDMRAAPHGRSPPGT